VVKLWITAEIANYMPVGVLMLSEGFWGAHEDLRIFTRGFQMLNFVIV
jgi:hypothetical protein